MALQWELFLSIDSVETIHMGQKMVSCPFYFRPEDIVLTPSPVLDRKANEPKYKCRCGNLFADREPFRTHIIQCKAEFSSRYYVCVCQRVYSLHSEIVNHFLKCQYRPPRNKVERKHHSLPNRQPRNSRDPISATYVPKGSPILMIGSGPQQGALRRTTNRRLV